ncbi:uncharacterized protein BKA55DRAFT_541797 [Fusarium redolens]|uniref:Uncharacterized protein n=1 Tax=Fusarium redolens TaxID=48865 RepID=A0A9P9GRT3_FUSRE|nr:uncharacterized protein BKA55DRAFT_541797 [Fusarium redolens]KAH7243545.1 hypothetical protein BKA55DRAFT_541797 [Fusarium redolens]
MPDFRPLFFIAKVLTCCCCCRRGKPENARSNHPYDNGHNQRSGGSSENVSDYSEYSIPPAYPGGPLNLIHPDEFEHPDELDEVHGRDDFGLDLHKSRSLVPLPPTPRPSSPVASEPGTAGSAATKTISDKPVAVKSVIAEPIADEPGTPKPASVESITDEPAATKSVATEPGHEPKPVEAGPTKTEADRPSFVNVDLAEAGPRKSDIEARKVKDGTTEASSDAVGPTENKDEDKDKDKVSK